MANETDTEMMDDSEMLAALKANDKPKEETKDKKTDVGMVIKPLPSAIGGTPASKPEPAPIPNIAPDLKFKQHVRQYRNDTLPSGVVGKLYENKDGKLQIDEQIIVKSYVGLDGKVRHVTPDGKVWKA